MKCTYDPGDMSDAITYRQVGVFTKLSAIATASASTLLDPAEVSDAGYLEWVSNREPVNVQPDQYEVVELLITF